MPASISPGVYTHYKGGTYTVLSVATDATNTREGGAVVVYQSHANKETYCRDLAEFMEMVTLPDGSRRSRFAPAE